MSRVLTSAWPRLAITAAVIASAIVALSFAVPTAAAQAGLTAARADQLCTAATSGSVVGGPVEFPVASALKLRSSQTGRWELPSNPTRPRLGEIESAPADAVTLVCILSSSNFERVGNGNVLISRWEVWAVRVSDGAVLRQDSFVGDRIPSNPVTLTVTNCNYLTTPPTCQGLSAVAAREPVDEVVAWLRRPMESVATPPTTTTSNDNPRGEGEVETPGGRYRIESAEFIDAFPPDCAGTSCRRVEQGFKLLMVHLNPVDASVQHDALIEGCVQRPKRITIAGDDDTETNCEAAGLLNGRVFLLFSVGEAARNFTLTVYSSDPVDLSPYMR